MCIYMHVKYLSRVRAELGGPPFRERASEYNIYIYIYIFVPIGHKKFCSWVGSKKQVNVKDMLRPVVLCTRVTQ